MPSSGAVAQGVPRTWNFDAIIGRRTRSDTQAKQIKSFVTVTTPIVLPWPLQSGLEAATRALFDLGGQSSADFLQPVGEAALVSPDSVVARVQEPAVAFHRRRCGCHNGARRAACAYRCVGAHYLPCRSNSTTAADRTCRHGYDLRRSRQGRGHDRPRSPNARSSRRLDASRQSLPCQ
jgi:hypothetical protein